MLAKIIDPRRDVCGQFVISDFAKKKRVTSYNSDKINIVFTD